MRSRMRMHGFRITTTHIANDVVVVSVSGEADLNAAPDFEAKLGSAVDQGPRFIVIDLGHTTFIDSTALRVLMQGRKRLDAVGGSMSIVCPDRLVWKIFEITGLAELLPRYSTVEEAIRGEVGNAVPRAGASGLGPTAISASPVL
jgi:anti-sigma B factor antagonist